MKKVILYALVIAAILFFAGYIYIQTSGGTTSLFHVADTGSPTITTDPNTGDKLVFKNYGPAPEFKNDVVTWLNGDPQTMAALKGKVVLINFWTYSCITCIRMIPQLNQWADTYKDQGLVVISIHTPEYGFEKVTDSIQNAIQRYNIKYPVAQDNSYAMWNGYSNQFWPATYLVDKDGKAVYARFGDGHYDLTENAIQQLIGLNGGLSIPEAPETKLSVIPSRTLPFGVKHADSMASNEKPTAQEQVYTLPEQLRRNAFALEGTWKLGDDKADLTQGYGRIMLSYNATKVRITAQSIKPVTLKIIIDGKPQPDVTVEALQDYDLFSADKSAKHTLEIDVPQSGFEATKFIFE